VPLHRESTRISWFERDAVVLSQTTAADPKSKAAVTPLYREEKPQRRGDNTVDNGNGPGAATADDGGW